MSLFIPNHEQEPWGNGVINRRADEKFWYFWEALAVFIIQLKTCFTVFGLIVLRRQDNNRPRMSSKRAGCHYELLFRQIRRKGQMYRGNYAERDRSVSISGNYGGTLNDDSIVEVKKTCVLSF